MTRAPSNKASIAQACSVCYQKKARQPPLDVGGRNTADANVERVDTMRFGAQQILLHELLRLRKRKRASSSLGQINGDETSQGTVVISPDSITLPQAPASIIEDGPPERDRRPAPRPETPVVQGLLSPAAPELPDNHALSHPSTVENQTTPSGSAHDGRVVYFESIEGRNTESTKAYPQTSGMSPADIVALEASHAFDLPCRAIKTCYIDNFFKYCTPFVPIVARSWLDESSQQKPSLLLQQAVLLAGSRVTRPHNITASRELYARAKALFFSNYEQNPVMLIITCLLLQWWNPAGPDRICMDNSQFWLRTGIGIAIEMGLHRESPSAKDAPYSRRLWWSLVARDCQVSAAHGRPRAIQLEECSVPALTTHDFPDEMQSTASASVRFVEICRIFGEVGESVRRSRMTAVSAYHFRNSLYIWARELPPELRLFRQPPDAINGYSFEARQIHVIYFATLILLFRTSAPRSPELAASLVAASFVAGIFEEFLVRDEIGYLGPGIYKFFLLTAAITLLSVYRCPSIEMDVSEDYEAIKRSLKQFSLRYPSALATLHMIESLESAEVQASDRFSNLTSVDSETFALFREFGPGLCRQWSLVAGGHAQNVFNVGLGGRLGRPAAHRTDEPQAPSVTHSLTTGGIPPTDELLDMDIGSESAALDPSWLSSWPDLPDPTSWILQDTAFDFGDGEG